MSAMDREASGRVDLIVRNAKVTTLQDGGAVAEAIAVRGERFAAVGGGAEVMRLAGEGTQVVDAGGRRVIPGLNDSHLHAIRGGLHYNLELRWDWVGSLARGLEMIREQAERTPEGQWVRVMGGWSPYQFTEKRMPTVAELNRVAPRVPVLVLFGYSRVLLNRAGPRRWGLLRPARRLAAVMSGTTAGWSSAVTRRYMPRSAGFPWCPMPGTGSIQPGISCGS